MIVPSMTDLQLIEMGVREAGEIALGYFGSEQANKVWYKGGNSPVSQADMAVNEHLRLLFSQMRPNYGWLSEETGEDEDARQRRQQARFTLIVDPIDGTRGFIENSRQWCISVAMVEAGEPVCGVLHCPALGETFVAERGKGAFLNGQRLEARGDERLPERPRATGSHKVIELLQQVAGERFAITDFVPSLAFRLALVAAGRIDVAFARSGAMEWDIAAADIILRESGCVLVDLEGNQRRYNDTSLSCGGLIACPKAVQAGILAIAKAGGFLQ